MRTLRVTVNVDPDDIRDVLAWHDGRGGDLDLDRTFRMLAIHAALTGDRREDYWRSLPASLQYCIHEIEQGRTAQLRLLLAQAEGRWRCFGCGGTETEFVTAAGQTWARCTRCGHHHELPEEA